MTKRLWLYPLICGIMLAGILGCVMRIGWMFYKSNANRAYPGAQLVMEVRNEARL